MANFKIVLDPGHGKNYNPSKVNGKWIVDGFYEGNNNYEAVQMLVKELQKYQDVEIVVTRKNLDDDPSLNKRGEMGRDADLFFSWHSNGYNREAAHGVSSFSSVRRDGKALCDAISDAIVDVFKECGSLSTYYRGYSQKEEDDKLPNVDYYGVLRSSTLENPDAALYGAQPIDSKCKNSIIIEHGFHTNFEECTVLNNPEYLEKIVKAEAKVIADYFDLKEKEPDPSVPQDPAPDGWYWYAMLSANKNKKYAEEDVAKAREFGFTDAYVKYGPKY